MKYSSLVAHVLRFLWTTFASGKTTAELSTAVIKCIIYQLLLFLCGSNFFYYYHVMLRASFHNMQSSIDDTATKSEFIWIFSSLLFICQSFITMSHSWDELGFIVFLFQRRKKKAFDKKKSFNLPSEAIERYCVWNCGGDLINWLCVECGFGWGGKFEFLCHKISMSYFETPEETVLPRIEIRWYIVVSLFNNCLSHKKTTRKISLLSKSELMPDVWFVYFSLFLCWWKGKSMVHCGCVSEAILLTFSNLINLLLIEDHHHTYDITMFVRRNKWIKKNSYYFLPPPVPIGRIKIICMTWQHWRKKKGER